MSKEQNNTLQINLRHPKRYKRKEASSIKKPAPCEDRTHDLQLAHHLFFVDYETDALPTELKGQIILTEKILYTMKSKSALEIGV